MLFTIDVISNIQLFCYGLLVLNFYPIVAMTDINIHIYKIHQGKKHYKLLILISGANSY